MNLWGETMYARPSLNFEVCTPAAHPTLSIRLNGGGKRLVDLASRLLISATVFDSMAAAGREFQSGIVQCQKEVCPSVVLGLRCKINRPDCLIVPTICSFICWD